MAKHATVKQWQDLIDHIKKNSKDIAEIEAASDVVDVVGTKAGLDKYSKDDLTDKDVIKVLKDETQNDEITYYRYSVETQQFTLVGHLGPYYTETETDNLLKKKVDILNETNGTSYINNEANGGIMKYTATDGSNSKFTLFDGSDGDKTMLQIYAGTADKGKSLRLNGMIGEKTGLFYKTATGDFEANDEIATKGNVETEKTAREEAVKKEADERHQADDKEERERKKADDDLKGQIKQEQAGREKADEEIKESLAQEKAERQEADKAERDERMARDGSLKADLVKEVIDRQNEDTTLHGEIEKEASARESKDTELDGKIAQQKTDLEASIKQAVSSVYKYKGSVATEGDLPQTDQTTGDVYNVEKTGDNYAWNGTAWDKLAGDIDLSDYATTDELERAIEASSSDKATKTELNDGLAKKQNTLTAGAGITITNGNDNATISAKTATATEAGIVKPDGTSIKVGEDGTISVSVIATYTDEEWKEMGFNMNEEAAA